MPAADRLHTDSRAPAQHFLVAVSREQSPGQQEQHNELGRKQPTPSLTAPFLDHQQIDQPSRVDLRQVTQADTVDQQIMTSTPPDPADAGIEVAVSVAIAGG
nr:hypothetical protein [Nocardia sp. JCM 34519.1]